LRRKVSGQTKLPGNWIDFLRDPESKKGLFACLTSNVAEFVFETGEAVYVTSAESVKHIGSYSPMSDCNHEKVNTRMVVYVLHALNHGNKTVPSTYSRHRCYDHSCWCILCGIGKYHRFYSINSICLSLGEAQSQVLPVFHEIYGCDTTSAFKGKGKKSVWQAWKAYDEVTETLGHLACHPFETINTDTDHFEKLDKMTVILYDKTSYLMSAIQARTEIFCRKNTSMDRMPPTQDTLLQHDGQCTKMGYGPPVHILSRSFLHHKNYLDQYVWIMATSLDHKSRSPRHAES
jgi:hypothetical protein